MCVQAVRAAQDEQIRLKDVEINELKSLRMDLDRELRDTRTVADRVSAVSDEEIVWSLFTIVCIENRNCVPRFWGMDYHHSARID